MGLVHRWLVKVRVAEAGVGEVGGGEVGDGGAEGVAGSHARVVVCY